MHLEETTLQLLKDSLKQLDSGFVALPPITENPAPPPDPRLAAVMTEVATKLQDNYPYFHPLYAGQMLKPPHPIARAAYALATWINPNNHALDGGRASSALEKEAVAQIAAMFGWQRTPRPPLRWRHHGEPRSPLGCRPTKSRKENRRVRPIALHAQSHLRRAAIAVRACAHGQSRPHGPNRAGKNASSRRYRLRSRNRRHNGNRLRGSAARNSAPPRALRFSPARRRRVRRIFHARIQSRRGNARQLRPDWPRRFHRS